MVVEKALQDLLKQHVAQVEKINNWTVFKVSTEKSKRKELENIVEELNDMLISEQKYIILL